MKRWIMCLAVAAGLVGAFALGRADAGEGADKKAIADEMAAWMELGKTGPEHAKLIETVGTWTVESKMWMEPGAEPVASSGKAVFTALLGGRFVRQEFSGAFMGQPFLGIGCTGYNNATKQYEDVWIDSVGTGMMRATGTETEAGKVWTYFGSCIGPGGKEYKHRTILKKLGANQMIVEAFCDKGEGETKCWEGSYTRTNEASKLGG